MDTIYIASIKELNKYFTEGLNLLDKKNKEYVLSYKNSINQCQVLLGRLLALKYLKTLDFKYNENNKPYLDDAFFNISHSQDYVVLIISDSEIGIDIEKNKIIRQELINYVLNDEEKKYVKKSLDFFKLWTIKESILKCIGTGINIKLNNINALPIDTKKMVNNVYYYTKTIEYNEYIISICKTHQIDKIEFKYVNVNELLSL